MSQRAVIILAGVVVGAIMVLALQWGRPILIPVALAVLLTFLVNPIVKALHRRGLNRVLSVLLSVSTVGIVLMCLAWMVTKQVTSMLAQLPQSTERIKEKIKTLKHLGTGPLTDQFSQMIEEISEEFRITKQQYDDLSQDETKNSEAKEQPHVGVVIQSEPVRWLNYTGYLSSALEVVATLGFALVLLVFFLIEREDLRDRIVLLAGRAKLAVTSKALEDITDRISRYIGMVAIVNGGFGLVITVGLLLLGVPFALLWGFISALLRFIPYIGPWIGALFPITMSLATSDGWWQPIAVFTFVLAIELITNNVIEPLIFAHMTGVSPTALLVSAGCWLYLWGPIGLVLSAPFAVCLVVLGKNIPELGFLYLLLGDNPALTPDYSFYQRVMLGDFEEAADLALKRSKTSPDELYDELLIPVLNYTNRDALRGYLSEKERQSVLDGMRITVSRIRECHADQNRDLNPSGTLDGQFETNSSKSANVRALILGCPATDETDRIALEMLMQLLDPLRWELEVVSCDILTSELIARLRDAPPALVFIASVPPGGLAHSRYMCKRLRRASPDIQIVIGRCGSKRNARNEREQLEEAGANFVTTGLLETRNLLNTRWPLLDHRSATIDKTVKQDDLRLTAVEAAEQQSS